jgi:hypothetical protein|tara:strand:- start:45 stop:218 length:174 start_codon:yes stop_codon:yes gene_type:complete
MKKIIDEKQRYTVYIRQHLEPISVMANSEEEAEQIVQEHHTWGKPIDVEIVAEKNNN